MTFLPVSAGNSAVTCRGGDGLAKALSKRLQLTNISQAFLVLGRWGECTNRIESIESMWMIQPGARLTENMPGPSKHTRHRAKGTGHDCDAVVEPGLRFLWVN